RRKLEALLTPQYGTFTFDGGGSPDDLPPCPSATDPQSPADHEQSSPLNKKIRTIAEVAVMPTEKQKTCAHPPESIVFLPDNITICHHCYGLLDENLTLISVLSSDQASPRQNSEEDKAVHAVCAA